LAWVGAAFFAALCAFAASARFRAHRRLVASMIAALPARLSLLFRFCGAVAVADGWDSPLIRAHLAFCASAIFRREATLDVLRLWVGTSGVTAEAAGPPVSTARSSAILVSMCRLCSSNPRMAAVTISGVSFVGICLGFSAFTISTITHHQRLPRVGSAPARSSRRISRPPAAPAAASATGGRAWRGPVFATRRDRAWLPRAESFSAAVPRHA
jgi:hypothetical protein